MKTFTPLNILGVTTTVAVAVAAAFRLSPVSLSTLLFLILLLDRQQHQHQLLPWDMLRSKWIMRRCTLPVVMPLRMIRMIGWLLHTQNFPLYGRDTPLKNYLRCKKRRKGTTRSTRTEIGKPTRKTTRTTNDSVMFFPSPNEQASKDAMKSSLMKDAFYSSTKTKYFDINLP